MALTGLLTIVAHEGKDFHDEDAGKQDPFLTFKLGKEKHRTKTHKKGGKAPKWDHAVVFNLKDEEIKEVLHIEAFDEDTLSNDKIGRADVPLKVLFEHAYDRKDGAWFQLVDHDNFKKIRGYVRLSIKWDGAHPSKFGCEIAVAAAVAEAEAAPPAHHIHGVHPGLGLGRGHHMAEAPVAPVYQQPIPVYQQPVYQEPVVQPVVMQPVIVEKPVAPIVAAAAAVAAVSAYSVVHSGYDVIYHDGAWKKARIEREDAISRQYAQFVWREGKIAVIHCGDLGFLLGGVVHFAQLPPHGFLSMHHDGKWHFQHTAAAPAIDHKWAHLIINNASHEVVKAHAADKKFLFEGLLEWMTGHGYDVIYHDGAWKRHRIAAEDAISRQYAQFVWRENKISVIHSADVEFLLRGVVHFANLPGHAYLTVHHDGAWKYQVSESPHEIDHRYAHVIIKTGTREIVKIHAADKKFLFEGLLPLLH
jgi:hypothetical protein